VISDGVVIVGGGLAGQRCAETLRRRGYDGAVTMVCAEPELPYDRPPLSKTGFDGDVYFRPPSWYADNVVELRLGERAIALDPGRRLLELNSGRALGYGRLLVATGAAPRSLPLLEGFTNAHPLRTLGDARRLHSALAPGVRLAIVGAGFIGQEVAATATAAGAQVTMLEAMPLPLAGLLGDRIGRWLAELHATAGVRVLLSAKLTGARGNGRVEELILADGRTVGCDAVIVGVGVEPAAGWLTGTALEPGGVLTDPSGRTAVPDLFAAGDVCRAFDPRRGMYPRTEHWDAASRQGSTAALAMLGELAPAPALPSFWSDQYGLRIQYVGDATGADSIRVDGDPEHRDFSALYSRDGRPVAALTVGRSRELVALRSLLESGTDVEPEIKEKAA
jgi:3-phenylpropionate/trans-cinnamate dioxygenase ferredoxin reductase subunit